ncbi:hypothetical protein EAE96_007664 [Botrytis aclada]|nr:hypothetical protein EAE96_007664 [Botrytis aclada]
MIRRCQLSSAANAFLNTHFDGVDAESLSNNPATVPYYDGYNWKSSQSAATELWGHGHSAHLDYKRIETQMKDSYERLDLGYENARRVDPPPKKQELVQRGTYKASDVPACSQTPFVLNPISNRLSKFPSRFENSHLSEHTGRLGLPVDHDHGDTRQSGEQLEILRLAAHDKGRKDLGLSVKEYKDHLSRYIPNPDSPGGNGALCNEISLRLWEKVPVTMSGIHYELDNGTDEEEKQKAANKLSKLESVLRRNQFKRKLILTAERGAARAQKMAHLQREFKSAFLRRKIEHFEYIKEKGGEGYLKVEHHLTAVPGYMFHEFKLDRLQGTGLWNAIGPDNGVKRVRPGSEWRRRDPKGAQSSLRMVSNASSGFQAEYVKKKSYGPPTSMRTVDTSDEPMKQEPDPIDTDSDEQRSDETDFESGSDEWGSEDDESTEY